MFRVTTTVYGAGAG